MSVATGFLFVSVFFAGIAIGFGLTCWRDKRERQRLKQYGEQITQATEQVQRLQITKNQALDHVERLTSERDNAMEDVEQLHRKLQYATTCIDRLSGQLARYQEQQGTE